MHTRNLVLAFGLLLAPLFGSQTQAQVNPSFARMNDGGYADLAGFQERLPGSVARLRPSDSPYTLVVEKTTQRLLVYQTGRNAKPLRIYRCSTGQNQGAKQEQGDLRTPIGIYYMTEIKEDIELPPKYGIRAYVLDYPNSFDRINQKNGYGIWLHGTDTPKREELPNTTLGCVVLNNDDLLEVSQFITLGKTPIIIMDQLHTSMAAQVPFTSEQLDLWLRDWESMNLDPYLAHYSADFLGRVGKRNLNKRRWRSYKAHLLQKYDRIAIQATEVSILQVGAEVVVNFYQHYQSDQFSDYGYKRLYWQKEGNQWRIVNEEWRPLDQSKLLIASREGED